MKEPSSPTPGSALEALDSIIASFREGELGEWELQLLRRRMVEESVKAAHPDCPPGGFSYPSETAPLVDGDLAKQREINDGFDSMEPQPCELVQRMVDQSAVRSAIEPSDREKKLEAALRRCVYFENGMWLGGLREDADVTYFVGELLKEDK